MTPALTNKRHFGLLVVATLLVLTLSCTAKVSAASDPFYMGADVSLVPFFQGSNPTNLVGGNQQPRVNFKDSNGNIKPADQVLYDAGANLFRLRLFVNPPGNYDNTNVGAIQSLNYDLALAQQIKSVAPGAKLLLDLHYSDTWADPGKQTKPAAWTNQPLSSLDTTIHDYTRDTLLAFKSAGVMPDMVQVGNEISSGMLWGTGSGSDAQGGKLVFSGSTSAQQTSWRNLGGLLNSAISGVRDAQGAGPRVNVAIHIDQGDQDGHPQFYFGKLADPNWGNVSDYDIVGVSYYPTTRASHSFSLLQSNLNDIADTFPDKKIMILEANYPWENSTVGVPDWAKTQAGQLKFLQDLRAMMSSLHNDAGAGIVYWYPEAVQVSGFNIYNGGATALFDGNGNALAAIGAFAAPEPGIVAPLALLAVGLRRRRGRVW